MKNLIRVTLCLLALGCALDVHAQATFFLGQSITCPASGTSITVIAARASRESYVISNTSGATVRIGALPTGTAALTDSNSILLLAGQIISDSAPSIFIGRVACMSNDATPRVVYVIETRRP